MNSIRHRAVLIAACTLGLSGLAGTMTQPAPLQAIAAAGSTTQVQVTGRAGVPDTASAAAVNLTATNSTAPGYVTAYPCGSPLPDASSLNFSPGTNVAIANSVIIPIGTGGKICLYASAGTDLLADITGWYPTGDSYTPTTPTRLLDTRQPASSTAPSSTAPRVSASFVETFDGNQGLDRFDFGVFHRGRDLMAMTSWPGDHGHGVNGSDCGDPTTSRTIQRDTDAWIYVCRNHLMTSIGDTAPYSTGWFAPKQTFTVERTVSWDVNITDLKGRQWWEVTIVPASFNSGKASCPQCSVIDWLSGVSHLPVYPAGSVAVGNGPFGGEFRVHGAGRSFVPSGHDRVCGRATGVVMDPEGCASKAIRRTWTLTDNANGTVTVTGLGRSYTFAGSFPAGGFNVVFKDHNYTPNKDGVPIGYTWHWDNIIIK